MQIGVFLKRCNKTFYNDGSHVSLKKFLTSGKPQKKSYRNPPIINILEISLLICCVYPLCKHLTLLLNNLCTYCSIICFSPLIMPSIFLCH